MSGKNLVLMLVAWFQNWKHAKTSKLYEMCWFDKQNSSKTNVVSLKKPAAFLYFLEKLIKSLKSKALMFVSLLKFTVVASALSLLF